MKILILYTINYTNLRNALTDNLYSFKNYNTDDKIIIDYLNIIPESDITDFVNKNKNYYDAIIYHWTFLSNRFQPDYKYWKNITDKVIELNGYKVAIPQDEYDTTAWLWILFREHNIKTLFTCAYDMDNVLKVYPPEITGLKHYYKILAGYIDDNNIEKFKPSNFSDRHIDIGYRARKLPEYFGKTGLNKYLVAEKFDEKLIKSKLNFDISNQHEFLKDDWFKFLLTCKAVLGSESGSSLFDPYKEYQYNIKQYKAINPMASFKDVEYNCFKGKDNIIIGTGVSSRIFDAAMTKTLQILLKGNYNNIITPNKHYIEINKDFSNIPEILEQLSDNNYCQKIINNCYKELVLSDKYTYKKYVKFILECLKNDIKL